MKKEKGQGDGCRANLGVGNDTDDLAVLGNAGELVVDLDLAILNLLGVLGESLPLGLVPILVESATALIAQVTGKDGGQGANTAGGLDVPDSSDDNHGGSLDDGHGLDDILLVGLGANTVHLADDVGHTSLESEEGSQVHGLVLALKKERWTDK